MFFKRLSYHGRQGPSIYGDLLKPVTGKVSQSRNTRLKIKTEYIQTTHAQPEETWLVTDLPPSLNLFSSTPGMPAVTAGAGRRGKRT